MSLRAVGLGVALSGLIGVAEPFGVLVLRGSPLAADFSTGWALFLFFVLAALLNPAARLLTGSCLRRGEMVTVYVMMVVACAVPSWGFTMNLVPLLAGFSYYATEENDWLHLIVPEVPQWAVPQGEEAPRLLFEGMARGEAVPWGLWLGPLCFWGALILTIYFVTLCVLVVLRKQWVERERLLFPLAVLPLELSEREDGGALPPILRNPVLWAGFLVPALVNTLNALHAYHGYFPAVDLGTYLVLMRNSVGMSLTPRFEVIGLSYLLSADVSLGVWVFAVLAILQMGAERMVGWSIGPLQPFSDPATPSVAHMALGALFYLVGSTFWHSRGHLRDVCRKALLGDPAVDDAEELMPYRVAVWGGAAGFALATVGLVASGMGLATALVFLLSALVIFTGLARIISQTGLAYGRATVAAPVFAVNVLGTSLVGPGGLAAMGLNFAWSADVRTFLMASAATGLKLAGEAGLEPRRLLMAIAAAVLAALLASGWAVVALAHTYGGINLVGWQFIGLPGFAGNWVTHHLNDPQAPQAWHLGFVGIGAAAMGALVWVKTRLVGFPVHPVGLALGLTHPIYHVWFSVFLAWLLKSLTLRYGGPRLYRRLLPFFLGMTLGAFTSAGAWLVIDWITGMTGNVFTLG
ncbi:MAG: DUF6785 family protein [Candidatus Latescibacterota bacterium]